VSGPAPSSGAERFAWLLREREAGAEVREFPDSTRTAEEAAAAVGCALGQIVKSLVFAVDGDLAVALVGGADRVDPARLAAVLGGRAARRADAEAVREATGYAIGGVPPFGHARPLPIVMDEGLLDHQTVWAAAGSPHAVFAVGPHRLSELAEARVAPIAAERP
jgi:Cys-tRNA(Pro) deacylase